MSHPRIDLHTHSALSDGTQTPTELVYAAREAGLDVVAITDHDTTAGWGEAQAAADRADLALVRGLEVSTSHHGGAVHLLAYLPDPTHPGLVAELGRIVGGRGSRVPAMLDALRSAGIDLSAADVATDGVPGRPHVADAMVRAGYVASRDAAFDDWLAEGRPGYVGRYAADLVTMIGLVAAAGGVSVVAHPWGRGGRAALPPDQLALLAGHGLVGVEVDHQDHVAPDVREELRGVVRDLDLVATGSSDHHGLGKSGHPLGVHTTALEEWERLLDAARGAAESSGRSTPSAPALRL